MKREQDYTAPGMLLINAFREESLLYERDGRITAAVRLRAQASRMAEMSVNHRRETVNR